MQFIVACLEPLFIVGFFYPQFILWQLIQSNVKYRLVVRSQLGPSIQSGSCSCARLQVSHNPSTYYYPELVINPYQFKILTRKQQYYRCIPLPTAVFMPNAVNHRGSFNYINPFQSRVTFLYPLKTSENLCLTFSGGIEM